MPRRRVLLLVASAALLAGAAAGCGGGGGAETAGASPASGPTDPTGEAVDRFEKLAASRSVRFSTTASTEGTSLARLDGRWVAGEGFEGTLVAGNEEEGIDETTIEVRVVGDEFYFQASRTGTAGMGECWVEADARTLAAATGFAADELLTPAPVLVAQELDVTTPSTGSVPLWTVIGVLPSGTRKKVDLATVPDAAAVDVTWQSRVQGGALIRIGGQDLSERLLELDAVSAKDADLLAYLDLAVIADPGAPASPIDVPPKNLRRTAQQVDSGATCDSA